MVWGLRRQSGPRPGRNGAGELLPVGEGCGGDSCDLGTKIFEGGSHLGMDASLRIWESICVGNFSRLVQA